MASINSRSILFLSIGKNILPLVGSASTAFSKKAQGQSGVYFTRKSRRNLKLLPSIMVTKRNCSVSTAGDERKLSRAGVRCVARLFHQATCPEGDLPQVSNAGVGN